MTRIVPFSWRLHLKAKNGTGSWEDIWSATGGTFAQGHGTCCFISRNDKRDENGAYPKNGKFGRDTYLLSTLVGKMLMNHPLFGATLFSDTPKWGGTDSEGEIFIFFFNSIMW